MGEAVHNINNEDDYNDTDVSLQLPPNATVPDATVIAVLYEQLYNDDDQNNDTKSTVTATANDNMRKEGKYSNIWSLITSPLLLLPSLRSFSNSSIRGGVRTLAVDGLEIQNIHSLCCHYNQWVTQGVDNNDSITPSMKQPMLQLDRFRSNFRALLRQYGFEDNEDDYDDDIKDECQWKDDDFFQKESNHGMKKSFAYERHYEDQMEKYRTSAVDDYDDCDVDDEDDDATVICSSNRSSISTSISTSRGQTKVEEMKQPFTINDRHIQGLKDPEDRFCRWIKAVSVSGPSPAPLDIVFRTELHTRLFWPTTLLLLDGDDVDVIHHQKVVTAYALGTTYSALAAINCCKEGNKHDLHTQSSSTINHMITTQLNRASQDMWLRYKAMEEFLDGACAFSSSAVNAAHVAHHGEK